MTAFVDEFLRILQQTYKNMLGGQDTVSAPIEVIIQHTGTMDDASAARFGRKVAETAVGTICEAFRKKGIHVGSGNAALKP